ncbi:MAG: type II toxin-antitoxin system HicA family toxin [Chloroflexi bacterium]|nr:type II toxin-antitoxin system HicA family toxin [Chloroflexota bacterium]
MSRELPALKPAELIRALEKAGFYIVRQSGSHAILYKEGLPRPIPVPVHPKELKKGLQNKIIKEAGLTPTKLKKYL